MTNPYFGAADHPVRPPGHAHSEHAPGGWFPVVPAVGVGGALGAAARYGIERLWPTTGTAFPWPILLINAVGCLAMGALLTVLADRFPGAKRLVGALLGTGFLGGFTTFSHYTDNIRLLVRGGAPGTAVVYLLVTVLAALAGVTLGVFAARAVVGVPAHQEAAGAH
ncbi:fluoride efflux transporter FluC [Kitasatospora sp. NPDC059795]|uniref:fluoride efflux transporter FluC n=1 Tax=Kitasatospora sp. NPDC059795 TaxID=3346949 RepID=UPI00366685D7